MICGTISGDVRHISASFPSLVPKNPLQTALYFWPIANNQWHIFHWAEIPTAFFACFNIGYETEKGPEKVFSQTNFNTQP